MQNSKLTSTFLLAIFSVMLPLCSWIVGSIVHSIVLLITALISGGLALVSSTLIFFRFMQYWDDWDSRKVKIAGIVLSLAGMIIGIYALFVIYELNFKFT